MATRFARATGDCFRLLLRLLFRVPAPDFRPDEDRRFDALLRALDVLRVTVLRTDVFRVDVLRVDDFRRDDLRALFRLDAPPLLLADFLDEERFRDELPLLFFRELDFREPPLREPPRDDFLLDAMNSLLMRWWCSDE